jgi:hypothetical protein
MRQSRRAFLGTAAFLTAWMWGAWSLAAQNQTSPPNMPTPVDPFPNVPFGNDPLPERKLSAADRMKMNQAKITKDMERLKEAVGELQKEFDEHHTTAVLSMSAVRKTEEIERLAREIRGLIRG